MAQENGDSNQPTQSEQEQQAMPDANGNGGNHSQPQAKSKQAAKRKDKKQRQKLNKQLARQQQEERQKAASAPGEGTGKEDGDDEKIIVEYVSAPLDLESLTLAGSEAADANGHDAMQEDADGTGYSMGLGFSNQQKDDPFAEFKRVFERFASAEQVTGIASTTDDTEDKADRSGDKADAKPSAVEDTEDADDEDDEGGGPGGKKMSKKQRKQLAQLKIAQLKQLCDKPDVVEIWDVTSQDPQLLVYLKAYRNTVTVPRHWSQKRKYLQGKRGLEKPPFKLPDFIEATGIGEMRQAYSEKEEAKKMKAKLRERMQPKMGRMDIDYQVLHDAFFKHQTKPKLTSMGELYYEGKEYEAKLEGLRPGFLSTDLRNALGMTDSSPPPWLINMQRYGPPPSYPNLRVPGLNAPIPPGCQFGYQPGGWGKPPVDEQGVPLYGDVFGQHMDDQDSEEEIDKGARWGELEPELEESEEEEEEQQEEEDEEALAEGIASGMMSGLTSGIASSLPSGIETPEVSVQLRKGNESMEPAPQLYTVLEQKATGVGQGLFGSDHVYVVPGQQGTRKGGAGAPGRPGNEVEITLSPEEIEGLDEAGIKALYDQKMAEARAANRREDFSDMVAAHTSQQKRKLQQKADAAKKQKTGSDFKF